MTQLAICGLGNIGKVHLENLRSLRGCRVVGLFDRNRQNLERLSAGLDIRAYATADEVFADSEVERGRGRDSIGLSSRLCGSRDGRGQARVRREAAGRYARRCRGDRGCEIEERSRRAGRILRAVQRELYGSPACGLGGPTRTHPGDSKFPHCPLRLLRPFVGPGRARYGSPQFRFNPVAHGPASAFGSGPGSSGLS